MAADRFQVTAERAEPPADLDPVRVESQATFVATPLEKGIQARFQDFWDVQVGQRAYE